MPVRDELIASIAMILGGYQHLDLVKQEGLHKTVLELREWRDALQRQRRNVVRFPLERRISDTRRYTGDVCAEIIMLPAIRVERMLSDDTQKLVAGDDR